MRRFFLSLRSFSHCFTFWTHTKSNAIKLKPPLLLVTHDIHHIPNKWWINAQIKFHNWKPDVKRFNWTHFFSTGKNFWQNMSETWKRCPFFSHFIYEITFFPSGCCEHPCSLVTFFCQFVCCFNAFFSFFIGIVQSQVKKSENMPLVKESFVENL